MRKPSGGGAGIAGPRFPVAFRPSAFASWIILRPLEKLSLPRGRPTDDHTAGPQRGCRVAHEQDPTGQGASLTPGTVVRSRPAVGLRQAPAAVHGQSLHPAAASHRRSQLSRGVIRDSLTFAHHPRTAGRRPRTGKPHDLPARSSPCPRPLDGTRGRFGSTLGFARRGYPPRRPRRRQAIAHGPGYYTLDISRTSNRCLPLHSCTITSHPAVAGFQHHLRCLAGDRIRPARPPSP